MLNNQARYGAVAMLLHWSIAAAIIYMLYLGLMMVDKASYDLSDPASISQQFSDYQLHKSIGLTILGLSVLRLLWRAVNVVPELPAHMNWFERTGAHVTHILFYGVMIGLPLTGWMMVSVSPLEIPTLYFAEIFQNPLIEVPHLDIMKWPVFSNFGSAKEAEDALKLAHKWLGYGTIGLLVLHVGAAMYHALIINDDVLARMLPFTGVGKRD
jgi:cytochrome b561